MPQVKFHRTQHLCIPKQQGVKEQLVFIGIKMVGVEQQDSLRLMNSLLRRRNVAIDLWTNNRGDLFIQTLLHPPQQSVLFQISATSLQHFLDNGCTLMQLFHQTLSPFVWHHHSTTFCLLYKPDADLVLKHGHKKWDDLRQMKA